MKRSQPRSFATLVQDFFCERLLKQQNVSRHTLAAYRDAFRLLLTFLEQRRGSSPSQMSLDDLDAPTVLAFLDDLELRRRNSVRTRNARLAAIRAFVTYASACEPAALPMAQRVLAIPQKRYDRPLLGYLTRSEMEAVLGAPDPSTWSGRRDRALLTIIYNTGMRVSEAISLRRGDVQLGPSASVCIHGKGRKDRCVPLWRATADLITDWLEETAPQEAAPLFPNRAGGALSRSGVEDRLRRAVAVAGDRSPSLRGKRISPHTLRHSTAMHLLQAGVDVTVIALWLGHESLESTHQYVEADLELKRQVLDRIDEPPKKKRKRRQPDQLRVFLDQL